MSELNRSPLFPRRTILKGATLVTAYFVCGVALPEAATAAAIKTGSQQPVFSPGDMICATTRFYDGKWSQEFTASFPMRFRLLHGGADRKLSASWDPRLFTVHGDAYAVSKETTSEVQPSLLSDGHLEFVVPSGTEEVVLQATPLNAYPNESLVDAKNTVLEVLESDGSIVDRLELRPAGVKCTPWGLEASVTWVSVGAMILPARISLRSAGPNKAPSGLEMEVLCDETVGNPTATIEGEPAPIAIKRRAKDGVATIAMRTSESLAPSSMVDIIFDDTISDSEPGKFERVVPRFRVMTPTHRVGMRASSQDSYYPVTDSGSQLSTYVSVPTAGE